MSARPGRAPRKSASGRSRPPERKPSAGRAPTGARSSSSGLSPIGREDRADRSERSDQPDRLRSGARVTELIVSCLSDLLAQLLRFDGPADATMSRYFKQERNLGSRDRSIVAEAAFYALRRLATLDWMMDPAHPARAPRLAALLTLARIHGLGALDARSLRNDERAVKHGLKIDLAAAPASVRAEMPPWLYALLVDQYDDVDALCAASVESAPLDLRVNLIKASRSDVLAELGEYDRVDAAATRFSPDGIRLPDKPALVRWPVYQQGRVEVQDEGSQLVARLVAPRRGEMIVDFCAGAGGKTLALGALMRSSGRIYAFDIHAKRLAGLGPRLKRSGLSNVHPAAIASENDIRVKRLTGKIDRVLVDAPCTGSGTLRRNPDLKWRFNQDELARVGAVQANVLRAAARLVKPGGRLVYATCSLLRAENQDVVERFLSEQPQFKPVPAHAVLAAQGISFEGADRFAPWFVMLPHLHGTDGFFAAVLERAS